MKTNNMPIVRVLLAFSWFIIVLGFFIALYLLFLKNFNLWSLITGALLFSASLVLSAAIRMFAKIGQIIFETKEEIQRIREISNISTQHIWGLNQVIKNELQAQNAGRENDIKSVNENLQAGLESLKNELQAQNAGRENNIKSVNENLQAGLRNQTLELDKLIKTLSLNLNNGFGTLNNGLESLKNELQAQNAGRENNIKSLSQNLQSEAQKQIAELKALSANLQILASSSEQINCDSKDLNQNIGRIRKFFEQIERHLDLKQ